MNGLKSNLQRGPRLGAGHFGEVLLCTDDVHGDVAVKVFRQQPGESAADWNARKYALLREGQNLSQAAHQNVVRVHNLLESDTADEVFLVMELCRRGSLQSAFDAGPMRLLDVLRISTDVTLGLQSLHARGMLHRDIKPGNLLVGDNNVTKLGDFGLVTDNIILGYASQAGYSDHLAPEIWLGGGTSIKSDIWALGMTMYRLIHGATWYAALPAAPRDVIVNGGFSASLPWLPHVPDNWRRTIRKMMHDDTKQRYQTANQVMTALAALSAEPNWACTVLPNGVHWVRESNARRIIVDWTKHSPRKHEWRAWSEPLAIGRPRTLGTSNGVINYSDVQKQLVQFFAT